MFRYKGTGWRTAFSINTFGDQIMALRGNDDSYSKDGTVGDTAHSNRVSDHNPDEDGIVRAIDFEESSPGFVDDVGERLRHAKDERLKYFIHDVRIFKGYVDSAGRPAWMWQAYDGPNGHKDHGHLSVVSTVIAESTKPWPINPEPAPPIGDHDMTPAQFASRLSPQQVEVVCTTRGEGGKWIVYPGKTNRVALAAEMVALLGDPEHVKWVQFYEEAVTEGIVNAAVRKAGA